MAMQLMLAEVLNILWQGMWARCTNPKHKSYFKYKELGVTICDEWKSFESFIKDMGKKPSSIHTLDRTENTKTISNAI